MSNQRKYEDDLDRLMSFLAESVAQMSDAQVQEEYGNEPESPARELFKETLKGLSKQKLRESRADYESAVKGLSSHSYDLPSSNAERRALLSLILNRQPELGSLALTVQHRQLTDLTNSDIESFLRQLSELGLLAPFLKRE
jgi:hypothetical protein